MKKKEKPVVKIIKEYKEYERKIMVEIKRHS